MTQPPLATPIEIQPIRHLVAVPVDEVRIMWTFAAPRATLTCRAVSNLLICARNRGTQPGAIVIHSADDAWRRGGSTGLYAVGPGEMAMFPVGLPDVWRRSMDGTMDIQIVNAPLEVCALEHP